jgi:hypothetical protein
VATQALGRLPDSVRQALLANVGSLISFRLGYDEASRVARELPGLGTEDIQALGQFEVAARLSTGTGSGVATLTGQTQPLPPLTHQGDRIRARSAQQYGRELAETDAALRQHQEADVDAAAVGRTRRPR